MRRHDTNQDFAQDSQRDKLIHQYIQALDQGDTEGVAAVLDIALDDPEIDRIIEAIHLSYQEELQLSATATDAEIIRELIHKHIPSAFESQAIEEQALTVGEVAARLLASRTVPSVDEVTNRYLLNHSDPLPVRLSLQDIKQLATQLKQIGVQASDRYWRIFRDTAITMAMARGQSNAQLAAAREERTRYEKLGSRRNKSGQSKSSQSKLEQSKSNQSKPNQSKKDEDSC